MSTAAAHDREAVTLSCLDLLVAWAVCADNLVELDNVAHVDDRHIVRVGGASDRARFRLSAEAIDVLERLSSGSPSVGPGWMLLAGVPTTHALLMRVGAEWAPEAELAVEQTLEHHAGRITHLIRTWALNSHGEVEFDCEQEPAELIAHEFPSCAILAQDLSQD